MLVTILIGSAIVGRLWAVPLLALTWAVPVALTTSGGAEVLVSAYTLALVNGAIGVGLRQLGDRVVGRMVPARA
jgi:hypothetical protein